MENIPCRMNWDSFDCDQASIPSMYRSGLDMYAGPVQENGEIKIRDMLQALWYEVDRPDLDPWKKNFIKAVLATLLHNISKYKELPDVQQMKRRMEQAWVEFVNTQSSESRPVSPSSIMAIFS